MVQYGIVGMIKIEGSTVVYRIKQYTLFIPISFEALPTFSKSFPLSFSVIPAKAGIP